MGKKKGSLRGVIVKFRGDLEKREERCKARRNKLEKDFEEWVETAILPYDKRVGDIGRNRDFDESQKRIKLKAIDDEWRRFRSAKHEKMFRALREEEERLKEAKEIVTGLLPLVNSLFVAFDELTPVVKMFIDSSRGEVAETLAMILGDGLLATYNECVEKISEVHKAKMSKLWAESLARHRDALTCAGFTREEAIHLIGTLHGPLQQYAETLTKGPRK